MRTQPYHNSRTPLKPHFSKKVCKKLHETHILANYTNSGQITSSEPHAALHRFKCSLLLSKQPCPPAHFLPTGPDWKLEGVTRAHVLAESWQGSTAVIMIISNRKHKYKYKHGNFVSSERMISPHLWSSTKTSWVSRKDAYYPKALLLYGFRIYNTSHLGDCQRTAQAKNGACVAHAFMLAQAFVWWNQHENCEIFIFPLHFPKT